MKWEGREKAVWRLHSIVLSLFGIVTLFLPARESTDFLNGFEYMLYEIRAHPYTPASAKEPTYPLVGAQ